MQFLVDKNRFRSGRFLGRDDLFRADRTFLET